MITALLSNGTPINIDFKDDDSIQSVVFNTNTFDKYNLMSIQGPQIEEIKISGGLITIPSLCPFLDGKFALPKLRLLHLTNIGIPQFYANQNCSGKINSNFIRDNPFQNTKLPTKKVEVRDTNYYSHKFGKRHSREKSFH